MPAPSPPPPEAAALPAEERATLDTVAQAIAASPHPAAGEMVELLSRHRERCAGVAAALACYPKVLEERSLGRRVRSLDTLVDLLAGANDADVEMFLPMRAIVGRTLLMARLNLWRFVRYVLLDALPATSPRRAPLLDEAETFLLRCVHTKLAEEVLSSIGMSSELSEPVRRNAARLLVSVWDAEPSPEVRAFFPLLEAVWNARRQIRVNLGTMLGLSETMMLLQRGCDPRFVHYFVEAGRSRAEALAFQEFLMGIPSEKIESLEQLLEERGGGSLSREETDRLLPRRDEVHGVHPGIESYRLYRERHLQAAARRLRGLPGPKHTAEEYVMIHFLERLDRDGPASVGATAGD